jgi:membrane-associated protease RseP (regulator of RpoE activity)
LSFPQSYIPEEEAEISHSGNPNKNRPDLKAILKHLALFIVTFICVTYVGIFWTGQTANVESYLEMWPQGVLFAVLLLGFLATHEFGHYFAAVYHNVKVTLPYFIPLPVGIGTMGAVIKIEEKIRDTIKLFDIGIAGPVAGFVVSLIILLYGFSTLPDPSFIENFAGHDEIIAHVQETGQYPETPPAMPEGEENANIMLGNTLLYSFLASFFDNVPPMYEMYHFPFLFVGWLGLFFTALNLTPIGQLDGGHILYALVGYRKHQQTARIGLGFISTLAGMEAIPFLYLNLTEWLPGYGNTAFILWALILFLILRKGYHNNHVWIAPVWAISLIISAATIYFTNSIDQAGSLIWVVWSLFLVYFVKVEHPPVVYEQPLTRGRRIMGWVSMAVFILCISPNPIYFLN